MDRRRSRAIPQGPELYERLFDQAVAWGVEVFEHDWLIECFLGVRGLRAPGPRCARGRRASTPRSEHGTCTRSGAWRRPPTSRRRAGCATSRRSARAATTATSSGPELLWAWFLHNNVMARAFGLWPYKDVFHSAPASATREVEALLAVLSAGTGRYRRPDRRGRRRADPAHLSRRRRARAARRPDRRDRRGRRSTRPCGRRPITGRIHAHAVTRPGDGATSFRATSVPSTQTVEARVELASLGEDRPESDRGRCCTTGGPDARRGDRRRTARTTVDARTGRLGPSGSRRPCSSAASR